MGKTRATAYSPGPVLRNDARALGPPLASNFGIVPRSPLGVGRMERIRNVGRAATPRALARSGSQREPGARRQRERALGQGGAHGVAQGRLGGIVERGVEGAGGGTVGAGERLPVVVEVGVVDARLERAAGDALQAGAAEPLGEGGPAHARARLRLGGARGALPRSAPEAREH